MCAHETMCFDGESRGHAAFWVDFWYPGRPMSESACGTEMNENPNLRTGKLSLTCKMLIKLIINSTLSLVVAVHRNPNGAQIPRYILVLSVPVKATRRFRADHPCPQLHASLRSRKCASLSVEGD